MTYRTGRHGEIFHVPPAASHYDGRNFWRDDARGQWARWTGTHWHDERPLSTPALIVRET